jgi:hypothetical protein
MTTDEALTDAQWHIDKGTRISVETTVTLMYQIEALRRKLVNAELQQQATEDRVTSALDSLATWRERAERAEAALQWRPIETAPRDGTHVLTFWNGNTHLVDWLDDKSPYFLDRQWNGYPTHWMPLPLPPTADAAKEIQ